VLEGFTSHLYLFSLVESTVHLALRKLGGITVMPRRRSRTECLSVTAETHPVVERDPQLDVPRQILDDWFNATYNVLRRLAASVKRADANSTIGTSTLVHKAWLKLAGSPGLEPQSEQHFKRIAARVMRQIVMDEARRRHAYKRGGRGGAVFVTLDDSIDVPTGCNEDLLRLDAALNALADMSPRQAELVQLRFFGGHDVAEASALLHIAESTALRDWRVAKAWLEAEIQRER